MAEDPHNTDSNIDPAAAFQYNMSSLQVNVSQEEDMLDYDAMLQCFTMSTNGTGWIFKPECMKDYTGQSDIDVLQQTEYKVAVIILYILVIIVGSVGNTLVVLTVIKTKAMWNATNIFIANLAVADVFVCAFNLPLSAYYELTQDWIFGEALCHVIPMAFAVVVYSSTLTLTLIAIDRYMLILHPLANRISVSIALILIFVVVMIGVSVALPIGIFAKYNVHEDLVLGIKRRYCSEKWPTEQQRKIYAISTLVIQHFLPLILISFLYFRIFRRINQRVSTQNKNSRRTKTTKMLVAVVSVFGVVWTPFHIHSILLDYSHPAPSEYYTFLDAILRVFAMSSSCINPLLYGWLNDNFRNAFLSIIKRPTATPVGIHNEDSEATRKTGIAPSPMRKFYRKITNFGGQTTNGGKVNNNSCCSSPNVDSPEAVPLQTVVVDRNGQGVVLPKEKVVNISEEGNGEIIGGERVQLQIPNKHQPQLSPEIPAKNCHTAQTPLIGKKV